MFRVLGVREDLLGQFQAVFVLLHFVAFLWGISSKG